MSVSDLTAGDFSRRELRTVGETVGTQALVRVPHPLVYLFLPVAYGDPALVERARRNALAFLASEGIARGEGERPPTNRR